MGAYVWEVSSFPSDVKLAELVRTLIRFFSDEGEGRGKGRWRAVEDLDDGDLAPTNIEMARLLVEHFGGQRLSVLHSGVIGVWRPGKTTGSASATIGFIDDGVMKMWSGHWEPFEQYAVYSLGQVRGIAGIGPRIDVPPAFEFPPGYRLWRPGDEDVPAPKLPVEAYWGPIGTFLAHVEGQVEAHPAAIAAHLIPCFGTLFGRHIAYSAGTDLQYVKTYWAVVGPTSSGGKGAALNAAMVWVKAVKPFFLAHHSIAGIGSGETLIYEMRDTADDDEGPVERRRIVLDAELSRVLRVVRREGSILGDVLRQAFDAHPLRHSSRKDKVTVSNEHHLSLVGSITPDELCALTEELAILNGFSNRYLYVWSEIPVLLPFGGRVNASEVEGLAKRFNCAYEPLVELAHRSPAGTVLFGFADEALPAWETFYRERRRGVGSSEAMKAITSRQVAHVARVATLYAALDGATSIGLGPLRAGIAWADYSLGTVRKVFTTGPTGKLGQLLAAIREAGGEGLDGTAQHDLFSRNVEAAVLAKMRHDLEAEHLIATFSVATGARPRLVSFAISALEGAS